VVGVVLLDLLERHPVGLFLLAHIVLLQASISGRVRPALSAVIAPECFVPENDGILIWRLQWAVQ
jgi:hypothetical protein